MKKFVKPLVIAASVAAVAGIGAVSFAKWEAGSNATDDVTGNTGSIVTVGTLTVTDNLGTDPNKKTLVPFDQVDQYDANKHVKVLELNVTSDGEGTPYYSIKLTNAIDGMTGKFKVFAGETYAAPTTTLDSNWKDITTSDQELKLYSNTAYIVLDSTDEANDMGAAFSFTITLAPTAPVAP